MALQPNALVTLSLAKEYLSIFSTDESQDAWVEMLINSASDRIEHYCGRSFAANSYVHFLDGHSNNEVVLPQWPVTEITEVRVDTARVFGDDTLLDAADYGVVDSMVLRLHSSLFPEGSQNVKVSYDAGYSTIPGDLQIACLFMVDWLYRARNDRRIGRGTVTKGQETIDNLPGMPKEIAEILEPFVNIAISPSLTKAGLAL